MAYIVLIIVVVLFMTVTIVLPLSRELKKYKRQQKDNERRIEVYLGAYQELRDKLPLEELRFYSNTPIFYWPHLDAKR